METTLARTVIQATPLPANVNPLKDHVSQLVNAAMQNFDSTLQYEARQLIKLALASFDNALDATDSLRHADNKAADVNQCALNLIRALSECRGLLACSLKALDTEEGRQ